jgi:hypothetical protein
LIARHELGLGSGGYGLLLGCVGVGALLAANFGPLVKRVVPARGLYAIACGAVAVPALLLATVHNVIVAAAVLVIAGSAWIIGLGTLSAAYQGELPAWAKARAYAYYLVAFQGASGIGALVAGAVAEGAGVDTALVVVAAGLGGAVLVTWLLPLPAGAALDLHASDPLPLPAELEAASDDVAAGPVAVTITYRLAEGNVPTFLAMTQQLRRMRRRTGAVHWHLQRDIEHENVFTELFIVGSWDEHRQQHARTEHGDEQLLDAVHALLAPGSEAEVQHAIAVKPSSPPRGTALADER